jgi:Tol biopolymer transport system component
LLVGCGGHKSTRAAIAFDSRDYRLDPAIFRVYGDGCCRKQLTHPPDGARDFSPAWSPDGKRLAFIRQQPHDRLRLYVLDAGGETLVPIRHHKLEAIGLSWSPDGRRILFGAGDGLRTIDPSDGKTTLLVHSIVAGEGSWSPDGRTIAFTEPEGIYLSDADGSNVRRLTKPRPPVTDAMPTWSPDGTLLAYVEENIDNFRTFRPPIKLVRADGRGQRTLTTLSPETVATPTWSPDGKRIAFDDYDTTAPGIYTVRVTGGARRLLFKGMVGGTSWSRPPS